MASKIRKYKNKEYTVEEILGLVDTAVKNGIKCIEFDGHKINFTSKTLLNFKHNGVNCIGCDRKGDFFIKEIEKLTSVCYLSLYSSDGYIKMTRDHIIPSCKNGNDTLENLQTMCMVCNNEKGSK